MAARRALVFLYATLLAAWLLVVELLVPGAIRQAYAGQSFSFINQIIDGRKAHPLEFYQNVWSRISLELTAVLIVLAIMAATIPWRRLWSLAKAALSDLLSQSMPAQQALTFALAVGIITGFIEALAHTTLTLLHNRPRWGNAGQYYTDGLLWMAPLANVVAFGALAGLLVIVLRRPFRDLPMRAWIIGFSTLAIYAVTRSLVTGLYPPAVFCLSLGAATQLALLLDRHQAALVRYSRSVVRTGLLLCLGIALGGATLNRTVTRHTKSKNSRNVLFIVLDTERAADLSLYGYQRRTTPGLESFSRDALVFDRAIATSSWTLASHASMFTGHWPSELSADWDARLDSRYPTLAEVFRSNGYNTAGFVANELYTSPRSGLNRGFDTYRADPLSMATVLKNSWITRKLVSLASGDDGARVGRKRAHDVRHEFLEWLDHKPDAPFFAFLNFMDTHAPYLAQSPFDTMFSGHPIAKRPRTSQRRRYTNRDRRGFVDAYDQSVSNVDAELGRLFADLGERGLLDQTVVIVTADHGEQFGLHHPNLILHGNSLYLPVVHVPLIIRDPADPAARGRISREVSLRDLSATMLDLAGIENRAGIQGTTLSTLWRSPATATVSPALSELSPQPMKRRTVRWSYSLIQGPYHYIVNGKNHEEFYNIDLDRWELADLSKADQSNMGRLRARVHEVIGTPASLSLAH